MDQLSLDRIRIELQKMVGLSQRIMQAVNFRGDKGYLLPRHPSSSTSCASTSASYQAPSSSTHPPFAPTASAPYLPQSSAFYATGTCFFCYLYYLERPRHILVNDDQIFFYRETIDTYRTGAFVVDSSLHTTAGVSVGRLVRWQHRRDRWYTADKSLSRDPADAANAGAVARDDGGLPRLGTACRRGIRHGNVGGGGGGGARDRTGGGLVRLSDSTGTNRRGGLARRVRRLHKQRPEGGCPVGLRCSLSDTAPRAGGRRARSPST
jgi:hypothetical protein